MLPNQFSFITTNKSRPLRIGKRLRYYSGELGMISRGVNWTRFNLECKLDRVVGADCFGRLFAPVIVDRPKIEAAFASQIADGTGDEHVGT